MTRHSVQTPPMSRQHVTETARIQHGQLAQTTILRLRRYLTLAGNDLDDGRIDVSHADQALMAAGTLVRETAALAARDGSDPEVSAGIARTAIVLAAECLDAFEAGDRPDARAQMILAAAGTLLAAFTALAVGAEEAAA